MPHSTFSTACMSQPTAAPPGRWLATPSGNGHSPSSDSAHSGPRGAASPPPSPPPPYRTSARATRRASCWPAAPLNAPALPHATSPAPPSEPFPNCAYSKRPAAMPASAGAPVPRKIECRGSMRSSSSWYCKNGPTAGTAPSSAHALAATLAPPAASAAGRSRRSRVRRERAVRPSPPCSSSDSRAARVRSLPCTWCWPVKTLMPRRRSASTQANKPESCPGCTATARTARGSTRRPPRHGLQQR
mmetsp:Transcript_22985/g.75074  ORF Transcript_22985/g.75074 Transcript_22985/m.75074 type:complete len:245 (-) Transcript_22985:768-1502(-)